MSQHTRTPNNTPSTANGHVPAGTYEAIVVSHLDTTYMGGLLVDVLRPTASGSLPERIGTSVEARYLMPFYGTTPRDAISPNDGYSATQKSYGMWMVPPDVGTRVLVIFLEGGSRCYWVGCIPDEYMNFMVPDGRASTELTTDITPQNLKGKKLPVGEFNKVTERAAGNDPTRFRKPYNKDFSQVLEVQGLIDDENRGTTTTSARREVPSAVFGVNTPGPYDKRQGAPRSPQGQHANKANVYSNRLGGHSLVMDDGDDKFIRKTTADAGPPEYVNLEAGETGGDPTLPHNELMRFRTRTGHQIVMHNTEDFIYISNARGTAWVELSSDGKIDVYANDSISIHSDQDINLTADRDVNIEGGRNVNIRASGAYAEGNTEASVESEETGTFITPNGRVQIESKVDTNIRADRDLKIHVEGNRDDYVKLNYKTTVDANVDNYTLGYNYNYVQSEISITTDASYKLHATAGTANIKASADVRLESEASISLKAAVQIAGDGGPKIFWNSGKSSSALPPTPATTSATVSLLSNHPVTKITPGTTQAGATVPSIVKRAPTHEPWSQHENLDPLAFKPAVLDREYDETPTQAQYTITPDTFRKNVGVTATETAGTTDARTTGAGEPGSPPTNTTQDGRYAPPSVLANDPEFQAQLDHMISKYPGLTRDQIYAVIDGESNFNLRARNSNTDAAGFFQFVPDTARELGTSTTAIRNMNAAQQLRVYERYLDKWDFRGGDLGIVQAAPAYASRPPNAVIYRRNSAAWRQNPGWQPPGGGDITVQDINNYYNRRIPS